MTATPLAIARAGVRLATRALPTQAARDRYEAEFLAELYGLDPWRQIRHTAGVLLRIVALRAALGSWPAQEDVVIETPNRKPFWRCRMFRMHDFVVRYTEDGDRYQQCVRCGTDRGVRGFGAVAPPPPWGSGFQA